jgi:hypothetical protein
MAVRPDETFHRLHFWTDDSGRAEQLAAVVLAAQGYENVDPIHPHGGPDGKKDARMTKAGEPWIMAVYFPYGDRSFSKIKKKFVSDFAGVAANDAKGMAFVTNQIISEAERDELQSAVDGAVDIFHVHRLAIVLDGPGMEHARSQFLTLPRVIEEVPHRNMREVFEGPTPTMAPERLTSLHPGMSVLGVAVRPAPDLRRHPSASRPLDVLSRAAERAAQAPEAFWPSDIGLLNKSIAAGWNDGPGHDVWSAGRMPQLSEAVALTSRPHARALVRLRDFTAHVQRTWLTAVSDDYGRFSFHAAREPEIVAETVVALGLFHGLLETAGVREVDVAVHIKSHDRTVTSERVVFGGLFGEVAGYITSPPPPAEVPSYHQDEIRIQVGDLADPLTVAGELFGGWLAKFRGDDLIARLRER